MNEVSQSFFETIRERQRTYASVEPDEGVLLDAFLGSDAWRTTRRGQLLQREKDVLKGRPSPHPLNLVLKIWTSAVRPRWTTWAKEQRGIRPLTEMLEESD